MKSHKCPITWNHVPTYSIKSISIAKGVTADLLKENDFAESYPKNEATF